MRYSPLLCLLISLNLHAEPRYALVIGNAAYPPKQDNINDLGDLNNPRNDAEDIAALLKQHGFTLIDHRGRNRPLLDASKAQMDEAVDKLLANVRRNSNSEVWFYFSGHGVYLQDLQRPADSANYLLPVGVNFTADDPAKIKAHAVNAHNIKERIETSTPTAKLMIIDACRDKLTLKENKGFLGGDEFRPMNPINGMMVIHATLHSYSAWGNEKTRNSRFTDKLLVTLRNNTHETLPLVMGQAIQAVVKDNQNYPPTHQQYPMTEGLFFNKVCLGECLGAAELGVADFQVSPNVASGGEAKQALSHSQETPEIANGYISYLQDMALKILPIVLGGIIFLVLIAVFRATQRKYAEIKAKAEKAARLKAEQEAKIQAGKIAAEQKAKAEKERKAQEEAARLKAELEAKIQAEKIAAEQKAKAEKERKAREEAARLKAEQEAKIQAEKIAAEQKAKAEKERKAQEEAARLKTEQEAKIQAEKIAAEQKAKAEKERKAREEAARLKAEQEARVRAEKAKKGCQETSIDGRYLAYNDGTVWDKQTGLMWMRCELGQTWNTQTGCCEGEAATMYWETACEQKGDGFADYEDWRIPTIEELKTLVDKSQHGAKIHPQAFPDCSSWGFWSSSPYAYGSSNAWGMYFFSGDGSYSNRKHYLHVRLVRGGQ